MSATTASVGAPWADHVDRSLPKSIESVQAGDGLGSGETLRAGSHDLDRDVLVPRRARSDDGEQPGTSTLEEAGSHERADLAVGEAELVELDELDAPVAVGGDRRDLFEN